MLIDRLDHLVLTVSDLGATVAFYTRVLGMAAVEVEGRHALRFGRQKINLHQSGREFEPKAEHPVPGSGDFCLIATVALEEVAAHLARNGVAIEAGPVPRTGALGPMHSLYIRDPDRNLVEIAVYEDAANDNRT